MKRRRDPLELSPPWHVDCRLEAELPEDNIVGRRFLVHMLATVIALGALLFTGWMGYIALSLRWQINDWELRLKENRAEIGEIQRMQREYAAEAAKIDEAYALARPKFQVWQFLADIGRTRPTTMEIDGLEWNDAGVIIRGSVGLSSERATRLLAAYIEQLRNHERIGKLFAEIELTDLDRTGASGALRFEVRCVFPKAST